MVCIEVISTAKSLPAQRTDAIRAVRVADNRFATELDGCSESRVVEPFADALPPGSL